MVISAMMFDWMKWYVAVNFLYDGRTC
jgi:hypothetical protein